jgi:hypothetical protein
LIRDLAIILAIAAFVLLAIRTGEGRAPRLLVRTAAPAQTLQMPQMPQAPQLVAPCPTERVRFIPKPERKA